MHKIKLQENLLPVQSAEMKWNLVKLASRHPGIDDSQKGNLFYLNPSMSASQTQMLLD